RPNSPGANAKLLRHSPLASFPYSHIHAYKVQPQQTWIRPAGHRHGSQYRGSLPPLSIPASSNVLASASWYSLLTCSPLFHSLRSHKLLFFLDFNVVDRLSYVVFISAIPQISALLSRSLAHSFAFFCKSENAIPFV